MKAEVYDRSTRAESGLKGLGIKNQSAVASSEGDACARESPSTRSNRADGTKVSPASPPATAKPTVDLAELLKSALPKRKGSDFSVDRIPEDMRLWEASHCRITDELGRRRRFGDFWDDNRLRKDTPASSLRSRLRSESPSSARPRDRRDSAATVASRVSNSSSVNGTTPSATETSGYDTFDGPCSPSLRDLVIDEWPGPESPSGPPDTESEAPCVVPPTTGPSIKSSWEKAGGEEWIVMGRKTVVFWIRFFWCPQCQDYSVASLAQLDPVAIHEAGINVIVISNGSWKIIKRYRELFKCPFPIYVDSSRQLYHLMGMTKLTQDFGPLKNRPAYHQSGVPGQLVRALGNAFFKLPLENPGKRTQLGGEFVLGPGLRCDFAHRMSNVSDHMEAPDVVKIAGCELCTLPERQAVKVAQEEVAALERENQQLEEWRFERANELERMKRKKAERRGLRYEASLRAAGNRLSVPMEEGAELDAQQQDQSLQSELSVNPPAVALNDALGRSERLEKQLDNAGSTLEEAESSGEHVGAEPHL